MTYRQYERMPMHRDRPPSMPPRITWSIILSGFAFWFILIDAYFRWT